MVPAAQFMPALSQAGLLLAYMERLIAQPCSLLDAAPVRVTVNVSVLPLDDVSLADQVVEMARRQGQDARRFVCEVDDVELARAPTAALGALTRLRVRGFELAARSPRPPCKPSSTRRRPRGSGSPARSTTTSPRPTSAIPCASGRSSATSSPMPSRFTSSGDITLAVRRLGDEGAAQRLPRNFTQADASTTAQSGGTGAWAW